jgi:hypothetical protein
MVTLRDPVPGEPAHCRRSSLIIVGCAIIFGCADRAPAPPAALAAAPAPTTATAAKTAPGGAGAAPSAPPSLGTPAPSLGTPAAPVSSGKPRHMPAPVSRPGGGVRIDLRGSPGHVRALERQADGSYKQVCTDAPNIAPASGAR